MERKWPLDVALDVHPAALRTGAEVSWRLAVHNHAAAGVALTFRTAQLGDVTLEREGSERYRWSDGRMFAQVVIERHLEPGETWTITLEDSLDVEPGAYEATGIVTCSPQPFPARLAVTVEGKTRREESPRWPRRTG